jgi:hypothetical protein
MTASPMLPEGEPSTRDDSSHGDGNHGSKLSWLTVSVFRRSDRLSRWQRLRWSSAKQHSQSRFSHSGWLAACLRSAVARPRPVASPSLHFPAVPRSCQREEHQSHERKCFRAVATLRRVWRSVFVFEFSGFSRLCFVQKFSGRRGSKPNFSKGKTGLTTGAVACDARSKTVAACSAPRGVLANIT